MCISIGFNKTRRPLRHVDIKNCADVHRVVANLIDLRLALHRRTVDPHQRHRAVKQSPLQERVLYAALQRHVVCLLCSCRRGNEGDDNGDDLSLHIGLFQFQRLIHMRLRQQGVAAVGKQELLTVVVKDAHIRDTALKVGHIVHGILGILTVAINLVAVLQQFGILHPLHVGALFRGGDG